jgi:hypothetical protein
MIGNPETIALSERISVEVGVLDGDETDSADIIIANRSGGADKDGNFPVLAFGILQPKVYAVCSIRKINGEAVTPLANEAQYRGVAKKLTMAEKKRIGEWAKPHYSPDEEDVKNEPGAPPFDE